MNEMARAGRRKTGGANGGRKLTIEKVLDIRRLYAEGQSYVQIGEAHGVSIATVQLVALRKTWQHV